MLKALGATRDLTDYAASKVWRDALQVVRDTTPLDGVLLSVPVPEEHAGEEILEHADDYVLRTSDAVDALSR